MRLARSASGMSVKVTGSSSSVRSNGKSEVVYIRAPPEAGWLRLSAYIVSSWIKAPPARFMPREASVKAACEAAATGELLEASFARFVAKRGVG
jgi:hypothetical protein